MATEGGGEQTVRGRAGSQTGEWPAEEDLQGRGQGVTPTFLLPPPSSCRRLPLEPSQKPAGGLLASCPQVRLLELGGGWTRRR